MFPVSMMREGGDGLRADKTQDVFVMGQLLRPRRQSVNSNVEKKGPSRLLPRVMG